jgi:hypothetical protein
MPDENRKPERSNFDPQTAEKLLELELMQKRQSWAQEKQRRSSFRAFSFLFLLIVIGGALYALTVLFSPSRVREMRANDPAAASPVSSPAATP